MGFTQLAILRKKMYHILSKFILKNRKDVYGY
ncbi:hypothetical protein IX317_002065 [Fusobacterium sp. DD29]|nr:hypothetical protein [Fusobacterium sp. DD45]MBR8711896.1 hypothetical protein [Fusobacterium sp. DD28]MBR8750345.1 hypothetical protein [Fusobacterium sp. DD29]MBR8752477.1 hypothetical protein [Fusobacterium sp. DD26]MBR8762586.1 hypothetical protein [Fusobacterium sp. DD25]MBR8768624.1 hypothetical protein [Fusobacterium sp. DD43]MBR8772689.1 hypothetical protein [Fusobacterium sp. DD40]MBR8776906.1 hypothetical protein [Fusobacterium sp. DD17]MBR8799169.1 hypothetical protein [Fusoba